MSPCPPPRRRVGVPSSTDGEGVPRCPLSPLQLCCRRVSGVSLRVPVVDCTMATARNVAMLRSAALRGSSEGRQTAPTFVYPPLPARLNPQEAPRALVQRMRSVPNFGERGGAMSTGGMPRSWPDLRPCAAHAGRRALGRGLPGEWDARRVVCWCEPARSQGAGPAWLFGARRPGGAGGGLGEGSEGQGSMLQPFRRCRPMRV